MKDPKTEVTKAKLLVDNVTRYDFVKMVNQTSPVFPEILRACDIIHAEFNVSDTTFGSYQWTLWIEVATKYKDILFKEIENILEMELNDESRKRYLITIIEETE